MRMKPQFFSVARHLLKLLSQFKVVSGLEINTSKTKAMQLGKWKNRADTPFNFNLARQAHLCFRCLLLL